MIQLHDISFSYDRTIFEHLHLTIEKNKVTFLVGLNGSGKSTLAKLMSGLLFPKQGNIWIDDLKVGKHTKNSHIRKKIGMVFQNPANQILFPRVYEDIQFILENVKFPKEQIFSCVEESLAKVGMKEYIYAYTSKLSEGQKQKIAIASQLALHPSYLIFDEATSMLDTDSKKEIYRLISELKKHMGILFITNQLEELIYADEVVIIENKKVIKYTIQELIYNIKLFHKHHLEIPFLFQLASLLQIENIQKINEIEILKRINKL